MLRLFLPRTDERGRTQPNKGAAIPPNERASTYSFGCGMDPASIISGNLVMGDFRSSIAVHRIYGFSMVGTCLDCRLVVWPSWYGRYTDGRVENQSGCAFTVDCGGAGARTLRWCEATGSSGSYDQQSVCGVVQYGHGSCDACVLSECWSDGVHNFEAVLAINSNR